MTERALITGGSGYFGSVLLSKLLQRGLQCRVLDVHDADDRPAEVELVQEDIRDPVAARRACQGVHTVYHTVAQQPLARDPKLFASVNIHGTETLLAAARDSGVKKLVTISSTSIFGVRTQNPVTEATPPSPAEAYGRTKYEAEKVCARFIDRGLDITIIRPRTILGHGRLGIFQILFEWIREGANVPVLGRGDNLFQFVHADDLADACLLAAARPGPALYNCGAAEFGTMREGLESLCVHSGTGSRVKSVPMWPAVSAMRITGALGLSPLGDYHALAYGRSMYFDISKARAELGWHPRYSNEEMLIESYEWYLRNRERVLASDRQGSRHRAAVEEGILRLVRRFL